jgi:glycosyltransferase involved in cell wall biosynthesis
MASVASGSTVGGPAFIHHMTASRRPTISAVLAAYQSERWIIECIDSILGQSRPPDEVVVVDDGSTDGTARELERYGDRIRVLRQPNRGYPAAINRAIREARGAFVAPCGADDIWEPHKLGWQEQAVIAHPDVDVHFGHAVMFGRYEGSFPRPVGVGPLDGDALRRELFEACVVNMPSVLMRRDLFARLGPFIEKFPDDPSRTFTADDYEYWFRCLRAGVRFYYEPRTLVRYRQHGANITADNPTMVRATALVHHWYCVDLDDRALANRVLAPAQFKIGRNLVDEGRLRKARAAFGLSLRYGTGNRLETNARALGWVVLLSLPDPWARRVRDRAIGWTRGLDARRGGRDPALP